MQTEERVRGAWEAAEWDRATTELLREHGPAVLAYYVARLGDEDHGREIYAQFAEDLWRGIPGFDWRCPARAWTYRVARGTLARMLRDRGRARERERRIAAWLGEIVDETRPPTPLHQQSEVKSRMRVLRAALDDEEQLLITLRVDRQLSWNELAAVMADEPLDPGDETREAARLRKRYQLVKGKLRRLAEREGLLSSGSPRSPGDGEG
ncbi:MAG: sigma factor [Polyangiaceae bacterium]